MHELMGRIVAKRNGKIAALIVSVFIILIFGGIITLSFLNEKRDIETPSLTVISYDNRVYYGGDFSVKVAYKYEDGRIEILTSNNTLKYESSDNIVEVDTSGQIRVVENIFKNNEEYQEHLVIITVSSTSKEVDAIQIPIKVVPINNYNITKYYYDEKTFELKSELIPAWNEQPVIEIKNPQLPYYKFEGWYVEKINNEVLKEEIRFYSEDKYFWNENITIKPKFYTNVKFNPDMSGDFKIPEPTKVYLGESIESFTPIKDTSNRWTFDGWFTYPGGLGNKNGTIDGKFFIQGGGHTDPTAGEIMLFAKWTTYLTLNKSKVPIDPDTTDSIIESKKFSVTYKGEVGDIESESLIEYFEYKDGVEFAGWYTGEFGGGKRIEKGDIYDDISASPLYDKILVPIKIDCNNSAETLTDKKIIYGGDTTELMNDLKSISETIKNGDWKFSGWYTEYEKQKVFLEKVSVKKYPFDESHTFFAEWEGTCTSYNQIHFNGELDNGKVLEDGTKEAFSLYSSTTILYGETVSLRPLSNIESNGKNLWEFAGWYTESEIFNENKKFGDVNSGVNEYTVANYTDTANLKLYAKWTRQITVNLQLGKSSVERTVTYKGKIGNVLADVDTNYTNGEFYNWYFTENCSGEPITSDTIFMGDSNAAIYAGVKFTITFNAENATNYTGNSTIQVLHKANINKLAAIVNPRKDGWTFGGWYTERLGKGVKIENDGIYSYTENIDVYPKWEGAITLKYGLDAVSDDSEVNNKKEKEYAKYPIVYGGSIDLPQMYPQGSWEFVSWNTAAYGGGEVFANSLDYKGSESQFTLYAKWKTDVEIDYNTGKTVTYTDTNRAEPNLNEIIYGVPLNDIPNGKWLPTKSDVAIDGYDLHCWNTGKDEGGFKIEKITKAFPLSMDVLYAHLTPKSGTISFEGSLFASNVKTGSAMPLTGDNGQTVKKPTQGLAGFIFLGWKDKVNGNRYYEYIEAENKFISANPFPGNDIDLEVDKVPNTQRKITWKNFDGLELYNTIVDRGGSTQYPTTQGTPTRSNDAQFTYTFNYWSKTQNGTKAYGLKDNITNVQDNMVLYAVYSTTVNKYTVTIRVNDSMCGTVNISQVPNVPYGTTLSNTNNTLNVNGTTVIASLKPYTTQYTFSFAGWSKPNTENKVLGDTTIYANFNKTVRNYTVTINVNDPECGTVNISQVPNVPYGTILSSTNNTLNVNGTTVTASLEPKTAQYTFSFAGWGMPDANKVEGNMVVKANFTKTVNKYTVTFASNDSKMGTPDIPKLEVDYGTPCRIEKDTGKGERMYVLIGDQEVWADANEGYEFDKWNDNNKLEFSAITENITITANFKSKPNTSCFVVGTMITLADGIKKPVEELKLGDSILTYNHFEGKYELTKIAFLFAKEVIDYPILNLEFSNGTTLRIVNEHGLFDCDQNKYMMINYANANQFVGHNFVYVDYENGVHRSNRIQLVSYTISYETTMRYSLVSALNINHVANGLLAVSDEIEGLFNIFTYGDDMKYLENEIISDIEKYGLTDYSEWSNIITYEEFIAFGGQYIGISFAKNLTTREKIINLINIYFDSYARK